MFTIIACIIIIVAWAWAYKYIYDASDSELKKNRKWIEQLPSLISTLGVIGEESTMLTIRWMKVMNLKKLQR